MPTAALRPCRTCGEVGCATHIRAPWAHRTPTKRITGGKLQKLRQRLFQAQPLCVLCAQHGRVAVATIRDHRIPLAEGGLDDASNEQGVCYTCHQAKTATESQRGRARYR